jgi:hypothetical protein
MRALIISTPPDSSLSLNPGIMLRASRAPADC